MPWQDMMLVISLLRGYVLVVMLSLLKKISQVRTAPTPSQPPTPYADNEKPLPGEVLREEVEEPVEEKLEKPTDRLEAETLTADKIDEMEDKLAAATEEKCVISEGNPNPPDLVSQVPPLPPTTPDGGVSASAETDSLADLDIVAVSGDPRPDSPPECLDTPPDTMTTPPDALDTPPDMPDTPPDTPGSPVISLPDAPCSDPGSPELQVSNISGKVISNF